MKSAISILAAVATVLLSLPSRADEARKDGPPPLPPEVKRTVDALVGRWVLEGTLTGLEKRPIQVKETLECRKAAGGRAVHCQGKGTVPGMGKVEDEALVTYDEEGKAVRFIGISSTGEVHDHRCQWKDPATLVCDPLVIPASGQEETVELTMIWIDAKHLALTEVTTTKDGKKISYAGKGKR